MNQFLEQSANTEQSLIAGMPLSGCHGILTAYFELYKRINHLEGSIVNCGIESDDLFISFAFLRSLLNSRKLISFEKHHKYLYYDCTNLPYGSLDYRTINSDIDTSIIQLKMLQKGINNNTEFVPDYIGDAIPQYLIENPELKIAFLTINLDEYDATLTALQFFYPRLVQGGILILDNYSKQEDDFNAVNNYFIYENIEINRFFDKNGPHFLVKKH